MDSAEDTRLAQIEFLHRLIQSDIKPRQLLHAVVTLGIPDHLLNGSRSADALASLVDADPVVLRRLLRGLVALDLLHEDQTDSFQLTASGRLLCRIDPSHLRGYVLNAGDRDQAWTALRHTLETGETPFDHVHGRNIFDHIGRDLDRAAAFHEWMANGGDSVEAIASTCPVPSTGRVLDVGGGRGDLLAALLRQQSLLTGVLYDTPDRVKVAHESLRTAGVRERCAIVAGDFFTEVPAGADAYVLCRILHDWDDQRARLILQRCRAAMSPSAALFIIEKIMPVHVADDPSVVFLDLDMLVETGGTQRSEAQYRRLLEQEELDLVRVVPRAPAPSIMVARRLPTNGQ